jgi:putative peptide zinc metalloprotease protein
LQIDSEAKIELHKFYSRKEQDCFIVWTELKTNFVELSTESFNALNLIEKGLTIIDVQNVLEKKYGEPFNVSDFVEELVELGFVKSIDEIPVKSSQERNSSLSFIKKKHVYLIYSKPMLLIYSSIIFSGILILFFNPSYLPSYENFFFVDNYLLTMLVSIVSVFVLVFIHEFAHLIAGKAVGVYGNFSIGMRLFYPVAETNLTGLWSVPRKKRYIPFLAGMLNDALIISIIIIFFWLSENGVVFGISVPFSFFKFLILIMFYGIFWQFLFFVRTDIYFVVSTFLGTKNLYNDSWNLIRNKFLSFLKRETKEAEIDKKEMKIIKIYSIFMLLGTIISLLFFFFLGLPILLEILAVSVDKLILFGTIEFVEGLVLFLVTFVQLGGILFYLIKGISSIIYKKRQNH